MIKRLTGGTILIAALILLLFSCSKKSSDTTPPVEGPGAFDKTAMLTNYADNVIIPEYQHLQENVNALVDAVNAFADAPSAEAQNAAKTAYSQAYVRYQYVEVFNFGPAGTAQLDYYLNFSGGFNYSFTEDGTLAGFTVDSASIEENIASGTYDLTTYDRNNFYSQGFPALEYLMFGPNAIAKFGNNTANRAKYLKDVVLRMKTLVDKVAADWSVYRATFVANTKSDAGSPIGNIVNMLAYEMDMMKGPRIGWPFGKQSNGIVFASKSEGYFAQIGSQLARANIRSLKNAYLGGSGSKGISAYLVSLKKESLNADVLAQFDIVTDKLDQVPDPLSASFTSDAGKVEDAYKEIQKLLTLLKTDVSSALGVQISFMDNDGD
jgi:predicted lipoprotein